MLEKYRRVRRWAMFTTLLVLSLTGCFGGGGDDSAPVVQPLTYVGKTDPADISLANTPTLMANVLYGGSAASDIPTGVSITTGEILTDDVSVIVDNLLSIFHYSMDDIIGTATNGYSIPLAVDINENVSCESGYFTLKGTLDDYTGTGILAVEYVNCVTEGVTYNGSGRIIVSLIDYDSFIMTMDFLLLTMTGPDFSGSMSGSITIDDSIYGNSIYETITMNFVSKDDVLDKMFKYENYVMSFYISDIYSISSNATVSFSGAPVAIVYDSVHGGIRVETILPLAFSSYALTYPDDGGELLFTGNNSSIYLTVLSGRHVKLELDIDGVAGYEVERYLPWEEMDNYIDTDLADSDVDGMHNSWETSNGLDPNTNDAGDDPDMDTFTNLQEYQGGSDPQSSSSTPATP